MRNFIQKSPDVSNLVVEIFSYEIWVYLAYIILPILYLAVFIYVRCSKVCTVCLHHCSIILSIALRSAPFCGMEKGRYH